MDALSYARADERGQALVFAVVLIGLAAAAMSGARLASERLLAGVREQRAAEAAVAAAGTAVEDIAVARVRQLGHDLDRAETAALAADGSVQRTAKAAATTITRLHGVADPASVAVESYGLELEVRLVLAGRTYVALLEPGP